MTFLILPWWVFFVMRESYVAAQIATYTLEVAQHGEYLCIMFAANTDGTIANQNIKPQNSKPHALNSKT